MKSDQDRVRVLYVEDSSKDADLTRTHFQEEAPEFDLDIVETGQGCLNRLCAELYDILLLDNQLPDMDSTDLLRKLNTAGIRIPVVIVTSTGSEDLVLRSLRAGAQDYVVKNGNYLSQLPTIVREVLHEFHQKPGKYLGQTIWNILYVEISAADVDLTRKHLNELVPRFQIDAAASGAEALVLLEKKKYELVLSDLQLPEMTGLDLLREIKRRGISVPFIIVTEKGDEHTAAIAMKLGAYDYIIKREDYFNQLPYIIENAITRHLLEQTNRRLGESEEKFRTLVERLPAITYIAQFGETGDWVYVSPQVLPMLGFSQEEWFSTPGIWLRQIHSDDQDRVMRLEERCRTTGSVFQAEYRMFTRSSDLRWVHDEAVVVHDSLGTPKYLQGLITDITTMKEVEETTRKNKEILEETKRELELAIQGAGVGLWDWKIDQGLIHYSPEWKKQLGYRDNELQNTFEEWESRLHRDDHDHVLRFLQEYLEGKRQAYDVEFRLRHKDGSYRWILARASLEYGSAGKPSRMSGCHVDITAQKNAEVELTVRARQQSVVAEVGQKALLFNDLFALMNDAVVLVAQGLGVELCKVLELLPSGDSFLLRAGVGWKSGLIGTAYMSAGVESQAGFALKSDVPVIVEDLFAETRFPGSPLLHEHGVISGVSTTIYGKEKPFGVLSAHSIHKRYFTGDDVQFLRAIAHILGAAVARTQTEVERKQLEEQLRVSQKMEAIGQLAGGVAHDFNNILMAISAYSELMMAKMKESDPLLPDAREVLKASDRGASLTRQLLAFSRRQVLAPKILDLNIVIENNEGMLRRLIGEDVELVTNLSPTLGRIEADPGQLEQILLNLSVNARDAMRNGGMLFLHTANEKLEEGSVPKVAEMKPGHYAVLTVTDTGVGMDTDTMTRIFEPFFTTKEQGKGTGLGLATVYGIVKQSGAHITVLSTPGKGTTFRIYFPSIGDHADAEEVSTASGALFGGPETILFVDDNEPVRAAMTCLLQMKGYTVLSAETGDAALEIARNHPGTIHLLITDIVMPHMSGTELARKLQSLRSPLKVLYISGYTVDDLFYKDTLNSDSAFLQKPVTLKVMLEKVREMLQPEV